MNKVYLILVCGRPGSGKSTLAKSLAKELKAVYIDKDCIDEGFSPGDRGPLYQSIIQPRAYQSLINLAKPNLQMGMPVILDAPWSHNLLHFPELGEAVLNLAEQTQAQLIVFDIVLPQEIVRERLMVRGLERDQAKLTKEGWEEFVKRHRFGEKNPLPHFVVDGRKSPQDCLKSALEYIKNG